MPSLKNEIQKKWKPRLKNSHKGDYGRVFILAGSSDYSGAAYLTGAACLRAGAGLVTLGVPESIHAIVARRQPELIVKAFPAASQGSFALKGLKKILKELSSQEVLAIGPGMSQVPKTQKLIRTVFKRNKLPVILDADGLNAFKGHTELLKKGAGRTILTPHPGEFFRLFGGRLRNEYDRKKRAQETAKKYGCIVVLKGHRTVVAHPDGSMYVNTTGNPGMAAAGTGDVLTGVIAALAGQKFSLWDSARFAVYLHGLSGDLAARRRGQISLIAGDLIDFLPPAIQKTISK